MNKRIILTILLGLVILGPILLVIFARPRNPVAIIKVVDAAGKPVVGAKARPYALRPKRGGADYFWTDRISVKPDTVTSDANGYITVPYPFYIFEKLETGEISVTVDHPDFCQGGFPRNVAFAPPQNARFWQRLAYPLLVMARRVPARPDPIVLKRGGVLRVSAYLESKDNLVTNIHVQCTSTSLPENDFWTADGRGGLTTRRISEGQNVARVAYLPEKGKCWFSDEASFTSMPGQTNELQLQVKPGLRLTGKLSDAVPRPVAHGRVQIEIFPTGGGDGLIWQNEKMINADGTFVFESLPPGKVEAIAICDGFVSENGPGTSTLRRPQTVQLDTSGQQIEITMEPTATCVVTVMDDHDKPLAGANVGFWPNVIWGNRGSTIFARSTVESEEMIGTGLRPDWQKIMAREEHLFSGTTDGRGIAVISNLPSFDKTEDFSVMHDAYEMPIDRSNGYDDRGAKMKTTRGGTNVMTVKLQKKGTQMMQPTP